MTLVRLRLSPRASGNIHFSCSLSHRISHELIPFRVPLTPLFLLHSPFGQKGPKIEEEKLGPGRGETVCSSPAEARFAGLSRDRPPMALRATNRVGTDRSARFYGGISSAAESSIRLGRSAISGP